uniref:response regulator n=1 Tax=Aeromonas jandaei TaxID=650 RepID=UPI002AA0D327
VKFTSHGFVELSIKLIEDRACEQNIEFIIKDSGIGISDDKKEKIFEAFEQADSSVTRHYGGSGLGLSISSFLAKLMGGSISVYSALGVGTAISLNITLRKAFTSKQLLDRSMRAKISIKDTKIRMTLISYFNLLGVILCDDSAENIDLHIGDEHTAEDCNIIITKSGCLGFTKSHGKFFIDGSSITGYGICSICNIINNHKTPEKELSKLPVEIMDFKAQRAFVLVVEDNKLNQLVIERQLKHIGVKYDLAKNGQEALEMLIFKRYDLVLCDGHMPVLDGYEFTRKLRLTPLGKILPIIAMTANVLEEQVERCLIAGMNDILCKPIKIESLISTIQKWYDPIPQSKQLLNPSIVDMLLNDNDINNVVELFYTDLQESMMVECHSATDFANLLHRQAGTLAILKLDDLAHDAWVLEENIRANSMTDYEKKEFEKFQKYIVQVIEELIDLK